MIQGAAQLEIDYTNNRARVLDITDYSPIDTSVVQTTSTWSVSGPDGVLIVSGLTVDITAGATATAWFNLPIGSSGTPLIGDYDVVGNVTYSLSGFAIDQFTSAPSVIWISLNVEDIFDEPGATNSVTAASATTPGNDGVKTVVAAVWNGLETEIEVSQSLTAEAGGSATLSFSVTYNTPFYSDSFTFTSCAQVTLDVNATYNCDDTQFGQIVFADETVLPAGQTLISRAWSIAYPTNLTNPASPANITSSLPTVTVNQLATGQWTYVLTYNVSILQSDGLIITYTTTTGSVPVNVSCAGTFCELICGIKNLYTLFANAWSCGKPNSQYAEAVALIPGYYTIAVESKKCNDFDTYNTYVEKIRDLLGTCDCGCTDCNDTEVNHWINNAGFESQSLIEALSLQVDGFAQFISDNAAATAAYNALVVQMNDILAQTVAFVSDMGEIQGQIDSLNPDDPDFDYEVTLIEANLTSLIAGFGSVQTDIGTLITAIEAFQTTYFQYATYWDDIITGYNLLNTTITGATTDASDLLTLIGTLTTVNYASLIAGIQADALALAGVIDSMNAQQITIATNIQGLVNSTLLIWGQVLANTNQIAQILATADDFPQINGSIFAGLTPYSQGTGPGPVTTTLPVAGLVNIPISSDYFQFTAEMDVLGITVGKKFVDVEFFCYQETGNSSANVTIEGQSILADSVNTDEAGTFRARIGTKKSGTDTVFTVQRLFTVNDFNAGTIGPSSAYYEFTNLITAGNTMELSITPGGVAANDLVFMFPTIEPKQTP